MTYRLRTILLFTVCSLIGVLILQGYFGVQVYRQHRAGLAEDVNRAFSEALTMAEENRIDSINALFALDIQNPELAKLGLESEDGVRSITVTDPTTGLKSLSIRLSETEGSKMEERSLSDELIEYNRNFLKENTVMYWTDSIGGRLSGFADSIQLSRSVVEKAVRRELDSLKITSTFRLLLSHDTLSKERDEMFTVGSRRDEVKIDGFTAAEVQLEHSVRETLRRAAFVYLMTAVVLVLILSSFAVLLRFVRRQKQLALLKDDFIDNVTHELLTPITTLQLALDRLNEEQTAGTVNKYLSIGQQQARRIAEVVDHVLRVSFAEGEQPGLIISEVALNPLLQEVIEYHRKTALKPLSISGTLPQDYVLNTDGHHLANVLHNLIGNAVKYSPEAGGVLSITAEEEDGLLRLHFRDNGPGIPAAEGRRIFDKFHRVTTGGTHETKGLGIGLYYARSITQRLGGSLELSQTSPGGSTFSLTLPYPNATD